MNEYFHKLAVKVSTLSGMPSSFIVACLVIGVWLVTGPIFDFSDTWQLVINTGTTIITFLMVFLIQNTQNRDSKAMQLKLDELIKTGPARNRFIDIENLSEDQLKALELEFHKISNKHLGAASSGEQIDRKSLMRELYSLFKKD